MQTMEIKVPDSKTQAVKDYLANMGITVKVKAKSHEPNADTIAAMNELKAGKGKKFDSVKDLFESI